MRRAERSTILGANRLPAYAKRSMLQGKIRTPHACIMRNKQKKDGEKEQFSAVRILFRLELKANPSRMTPAKLLCVGQYTLYAGQTSIYLF